MTKATSHASARPWCAKVSGAISKASGAMIWLLRATTATSTTISRQRGDSAAGARPLRAAAAADLLQLNVEGILRLEPVRGVRRLAYGRHQRAEAQHAKGAGKGRDLAAHLGVPGGLAPDELERAHERLRLRREAEPGRLALQDGDRDGGPLAEGEAEEELAVALVEVRGAAAVRHVAEVAVAAVGAHTARELDARPVAEPGVPDAADAPGLRGLALRALRLALALAEVDIGREGGVSAVGLLAGEGGRLGRRRVRHSMPAGLRADGRADGGSRGSRAGPDELPLRRGLERVGRLRLRGRRPQLAGLLLERCDVLGLEPRGVVLLASAPQRAQRGMAIDARIAVGALHGGCLLHDLVDERAPEYEAARKLAHRGESRGEGTRVLHVTCKGKM
mmetsp:Transcript_74908/g.162014  ORF Transcript_74908/g.162014 Transcript_74908/m.162014 type:complete len:392 (-) Transcript_74908:17-1192(-)